MHSAKAYLAIDLGAESGRAVVGLFDGRHLELDEVHRFPNTPVEESDGLHWDVERLFEQVQAGIANAVDKYGRRFVSVGVDTWGLDYALLDGDGRLLAKPFHYRDRRTEGIQGCVVRRIGRDTLYKKTGIQFMPINTLYQLVAEKEGSGSFLDRARTLLFIPDLIGYWLTGRRVTGRTIASTSQFYAPRRKQWAVGLLEALGLPTSLLCDLADPGTRLGPLLETVAEETGAGDVEVVVPGTHDTASAVAAVPAGEGTWAYLSSGTWSLLGVETQEPVITPRTMEFDLTNEVGVCDTIRLLKNISGLWLLQQCRSTWAAQGDSAGYEELARMAGEAAPFTAIIDLDDESFVPPGNMPARVGAYCRRTGQRAPRSKGEVVRTVLEALALRYREVLAGLEEAVGHRIDTLHIIGGGARNGLLNQFTANSIGRRVIAGPVEATAVGNIIVQMVAMDDVDSLTAGRDLVRRSFELETHDPGDRASWDEAYERFLRLPRGRGDGD